MTTHFDTQHNEVVQAFDSTEIKWVRRTSGKLEPFVATDFPSRFPSVTSDSAAHLSDKLGTRRVLTLSNGDKHFFSDHAVPVKLTIDTTPRPSVPSQSVPPPDNLKPPTVFSEGENINAPSPSTT